MKAAFINQLEPGQTIISSFLVQSKEVREKKSGEPYLSLLLCDKTGRIEAKMWDNVTDVMETFDRDDFIKVKALVQLHQNRPQMTVHKLRRLADAEVNFTDYFPCSTRDVEAMWGDLRSSVAQVGSRHIRQLLDAFLDDPAIAPRYKRAPAAKSIHHAYLGGLLEHVLSLCNLSRAVAANYSFIDVDLLIAGAVLHDIGKIHELTYERGFGYSHEGQLLGHIPMAFRMIGDKLRDIPDFPSEVRTLIEHIVLSHHGQLEFGSPKVPQFAEAMLFHYLDDLDSKLECMRSMVQNDRHSDEMFTAYSSSLERTVLKKERFLDGKPQVSTPPPAPVAAKLPEPPPRPPAPPEPVRPVHATVPDRGPTSPFGAKLFDALREKE